MMPAHIVLELRPTDRILQRWAASVGDGLRDAPWADVPISKLPQLDDQTAIVVDQLILRSGTDTRNLVRQWYRTNMPKSEIARKLGVHRDTIYVRWNAALWYFRGHFASSPLRTLRQAALTDVADYSDIAYSHRTNVDICPQASF